MTRSSTGTFAMLPRIGILAFAALVGACKSQSPSARPPGSADSALGRSRAVTASPASFRDALEWVVNQRPGSFGVKLWAAEGGTMCAAVSTETLACITAEGRTTCQANSLCANPPQTQLDGMAHDADGAQAALSQDSARNFLDATLEQVGSGVPPEVVHIFAYGKNLAYLEVHSAQGDFAADCHVDGHEESHEGHDDHAGHEHEAGAHCAVANLEQPSAS